MNNVPQEDLMWTETNRGVTKWPSGSLPRRKNAALPEPNIDNQLRSTSSEAGARKFMFH
jgi:hypothetical protein